MSFNNAGDVWVWQDGRMGLFGRDGGHVRVNAPHLASADAWIARHGARQPVAAPKPAPTPKSAACAAPKPAPTPKPTPKSAATDPVAAARAKYARLMPEAFHAKSGALRKGWALVNGVPTWADAIDASASAIEAHVHRPRPVTKPAVAAE